MNAFISGVLAQSLQSPRLSDFFSGLNDNTQFVILVVIIGCLTGVICTLIALVSGTVKSMHRTRVEAEMKHFMIERGMAAEEIVKVIEAATPPEDATQRWIASWCKKR